jgi:hypothetical protein
MRDDAKLIPLRTARYWTMLGVLVLSLLHSGFAQTNGPVETKPARPELAQLYARPLKLPKVARGAACPVSKPRSDVVPHVGYIFCSACPFYGAGPAYFAPTWFDETSGHVTLDKRMPRDGERYGVKTAWVSRPEYTGPIVARTRNLDTGEEVGFNVDGEGSRDLQLLAPRREDSTHWSFWPSAMFLKQPGCYGMQIDTTQATDVVVFEAEKKQE